MKTVIIQIGNTDNKLTQTEWAHFVEAIRRLVTDHARRIHFGGGSSYDDPWQNACWVAEVTDSSIDAFRQALTETRNSFQQESVAFTVGETEFV